MKRFAIMLTALLTCLMLITSCGAPETEVEKLNAQVTQLQTEKECLEAENTVLIKEVDTLSAGLRKRTDLALIKLPNEVKLDVPFEPNLGGTCFSSSFAMVMRYWGKNVTVRDVLKVVGYPPFRGYEHPELEDWMEKNYRLELKYLPYSKVEDVKTFLAKGCPVVVHQCFGLSDNSGHNRVVIGYSDARAIFIINDPSELGSNYEMSYAVFETLWKRITLYEIGPENKAYLVVPLE